MLSEFNKRDDLLTINIESRDGHCAFQWLYNGIPFLEFRAWDSVILADALKYANAFNNAFKNDRIRDYPRHFRKITRNSGSRIGAYASFIRLAVRLGIPVKLNAFNCFHTSTDKGVRLVMQPNDESNDVRIKDLESIMDHIWVEQGKQFYPDANLSADESAMISFMALRYVASTSPSFVRDVENQYPAYLSYQSSDLDTDRLREFLQNVNDVGGAVRMSLLSPIENTYPEQVIALMALARAGNSIEFIDEILTPKAEGVRIDHNDIDVIKLFDSAVSRL